MEDGLEWCLRLRFGGCWEAAHARARGSPCPKLAPPTSAHPHTLSLQPSSPPQQELLDKCHPLGMFDSIATLAVAQNMRELFRLVLVDTPLAPYFSENLTHEDLDEMNIEIMRNTL